MNVLVIHHNTQQRITLSGALTGYGLRVSEAETLYAAQHSFHSALPHLVVLDLKSLRSEQEALLCFLTQPGVREARRVVIAAPRDSGLVHLLEADLVLALARDLTDVSHNVQQIAALL